jgi:hypothetical protein
LAFSVSNTVSIRTKSTPPSTSALDLLDIDVGDRVEIDLAIAGIVDVRRERQRLVGRADRAGDPALAAVGSASATARMIRAASTLISRTRRSAP